MAEDKKTGPEMMDEIIQEPTLDRFLDRSPFAVPLSDEELMEIIAIERRERAQFNIKEDKAQMKKQGVEEVVSVSE